jgi:hypothetical protein
MAYTYEKIATTTLGSAASSITFSSISGSYTDLILVSAPLTQGNGYSFNIVLNSDTGTNYSCTRLYGAGSGSGSSDRSSSTANSLGSWGVTSSTGIVQPIITQIQNYSNTTTYKTFLTRINSPAPDTYVGAVVSLWRSTSAITSVEFKTSGNVGSGSVFTLYGIKAE